MSLRNGLSDYTLAVTGVVAVAAAAGGAVAALPVRFSVLLTVTGLVFLTLVVARSALASIDDAAVAEDETERADDRLRLARRVYYLGAGTIGFLTIRASLSFTVSDWIFFLAFGLTCVVLFTARAETEYLLHRLVTSGVLIFAAGGVVSSVHAASSLQSVSVVFRLLYLTLVWFWLGTVLLRTRSQVETAALAWVVSVALCSVGAVVQFFEGDVIPGGTIAWGRMTGFTPSFNGLGGLTATAFVPALMLATDSRGTTRRRVAGASMALIGSGLLLSGSVGGLAAASLATLLWLFLRGVTRRTVVIMGAAIVTGLALMTATGTTDAPSPVDRIVRVTSTELPEGQGGSVYTRFDVYKQAWAQIEQHPFVGVGLDDASSVRAVGPLQVHSILIAPWFSAGILGLVGVFLLVGGTIAVGAHLLRHTLAPKRSLVAALFAGLVAFVVFALGEPILYVRYGWFSAALLLALHAQERRAARPLTAPAAATLRRRYEYATARLAESR